MKKFGGDHARGFFFFGVKVEAKAQTKETKAWPVRLYKTSLALQGQKAAIAAISSNTRQEGEKSNKDLYSEV